MKHQFHARYWDVMMMQILIRQLVGSKKIAQGIKYLEAKDFAVVVVSLI